MALCPGLIDTDASRPWFEDMSQAQTPAEAAAWPVSLALADGFDPALHGELVQFGHDPAVGDGHAGGAPGHRIVSSAWR